jgi:endonuclease/exonuclease/phosphatase family metal-dependent hydrolase
MPGFPKPGFSYNYQTASQINALREYRDTKPGRAIPAKHGSRVLVATWNVANLGVHERRDKDHQLIAEIMSWFDLVAVQEVNNNLAGLTAVRSELPSSYRAVFSDKAGNDERMAYLYDSNKLTLLEEVGEIDVPPRWKYVIRVPGSKQKFNGFDRNPYLAAFEVTGTGFVFVIVNVHLYFGSESTTSRNRRFMETLATARWADLRRDDEDAYTSNIMAMGDFNIEKADWADPIWEMLGDRGLHLVPHSTYVGGSNIKDDRPYDQMAFFPGPVQDAVEATGVFDFDGAIFSTLYENRSEKDFLAYVKYYISDHRPLWTSFTV